MTGAIPGVRTSGAGSPDAGKMKAGAGKVRATREEGSGERNHAISEIRETPGGRPARDRIPGNKIVKGPGRKTVNASPAPFGDEIRGIKGLKNASPKTEAAVSGKKERLEERAGIMRIGARGIDLIGAFPKKEEVAVSGKKERLEERAGIMKIGARGIDLIGAFPKKEEVVVSGKKERLEERAGIMKIGAREIDLIGAFPKKEEIAVSGKKERLEERAGIMKIGAREIDPKNAFPKKEEAPVSGMKEKPEERAGIMRIGAPGIKDLTDAFPKKGEGAVRGDLKRKKNGTKDRTFNRVKTAFNDARKEASKGSQTLRNPVPTTITATLKRKIQKAGSPAKTP